jgi:competence ComEA-like helix-hairpin-helix protein
MRTVFLIVCLFFSSTFLTANAQQTEWIKAYFNMPAFVDSSAPTGESIQDSWDLIGTLEALIDSATTSVDLSIYDLEHPRIGEALVRAKQRGLRIRVVTDDHNRTDSRDLDAAMWNMLGQAGIYSIDDDGDIYRNADSIQDFDLVNNSADMHNKFAVIDQESPSLDDDIVWTGSTNLTYTGAYNTNNVLIIKDAEVAALYEQEFEQMWGSSDDNANPIKARFHKDKTYISPSVFDVGGTKIEIYFAPQNRDKSKPSISDRLVELIEKEAQHDIKFQAFSFTPTIPLAEAIWSATADTSISLEGVIDPGFFSRYRNASQIWGSEAAQFGNRMILPARETRKLHHKVLLIDAEHPEADDQAIVVTGSYNFSNNAEFNNDENLIVIHSDEIADQYLADFNGAFARAQGELEAPAPPINTNTWYEVYAIRDGREFEIEILPGFGYPVRLLGARVPSIYAGTDSSDYYAGPAAEYLRNILEGRKVKISGAGNKLPLSRYGAYFAYVSVDFDGQELPLNKTMLSNGYATFSNFLPQHPDSVELFKEISNRAENNSVGIWKRKAMVGRKIARQTEVSKADALDVVYPININTADQATLQLLPGIGETYARRIIEYREQNAGFDTVEELLNIRGIGERRLERLRPVVTL